MVETVVICLIRTGRYHLGQKFVLGLYDVLEGLVVSDLGVDGLLLKARAAVAKEALAWIRLAGHESQDPMLCTVREALCSV